ncbi:hypothetical protein ACFYYP_32665 [Microbispora rosea]|uniref:hypothetical protein n=1 Tax=Microbispora rosea TaxID=58117 RepID=UPI003685CFCB
MTTPAATPAPQTQKDVNWDAVSAIANVVMAIGTVATLFSVAWTIRQQGKALSLQIGQLEVERENQRRARLQAEEEQRQRQLNQARRVTFQTDDVDEYHPTYTSRYPSEELAVATGMKRSTWPACCIKVANNSDGPVSDLSVKSNDGPTAEFNAVDGTRSLTPGSELGELGIGQIGYFIFTGLNESQLQHFQPRVEFSTEDGQRWTRSLDGRTAALNQRDGAPKKDRGDLQQHIPEGFFRRVWGKISGRGAERGLTKTEQ